MRVNVVVTHVIALPSLDEMITKSEHDQQVWVESLPKV